MIRVLVAGLGNMGQSHAVAYHKDPQFQIVGLVNRSPRPLREGIHVVRLGDTLLVKLLQLVPPGRVRLTSHNPAYEPVEARLADVEVVGRVVWKGGRL